MQQNPDSEFEIKPEAKFNQGMVKVYRMNEIRMGLHQARKRGDQRTFFDLLKSWRSELHPKMKGADRKEADILENDIRKASLGTTHFNIWAGSNQVNYDNLAKALDKYELFLGDTEQATGLGSPDKDDDEGL